MCRLVVQLLNNRSNFPIKCVSLESIQHFCLITNFLDRLRHEQILTGKIDFLPVFVPSKQDVKVEEFITS